MDFIKIVVWVEMKKSD